MAVIKKYLILNYRLFVTLLILRRRKSVKKRKHLFWVRELFKNRVKQGVFSTLVQEMMLFDREFFLSIFKNVS